MKMKLLPLLGLALALGLFGCATPVAKMVENPSGKPEVTIASKDVDHIKSEIVSAMLNEKFNIEKDTPYMIEFRGAPTSGQDLAIAMTVGNAYSTNWRSVAFTFATLESGTRVIASLSLKAQMPLGQINSVSMDNNGAAFNSYQVFLNGLKAKLEKPVVAKTP